MPKHVGSAELREASEVSVGTATSIGSPDVPGGTTVPEPYSCASRTVILPFYREFGRTASAVVHRSPSDGRPIGGNGGEEGDDAALMVAAIAIVAAVIDAPDRE